MKLKLINYLVCPKCKVPLQCQIFQQDSELPWEEILQGCLICQTCSREYPILKGIPRMLLNPPPAEVQNTVAGFGWEWLAFDKQIQNTYMTDKVHMLDFIHPTGEGFFKDKLVLDAGCGMGRFLKLGAEFGSKEIIGIDLSNSVEAAYQNTRHLENAHVVQADIFTLPFPRVFDYIFSIGVLHHLDKPKKGFSQLVELLNKDGRISVWVYSKENNQWVISLTPIRKRITSHLPKPVLLGISHFLGFFLYLLLQVVYKPANETRLGLKVRRYLPYNEYLYYSSRLSYLSLVSVIFDHLVPQLAAYISRDELESWFKEENLASVVITPRNNMSWRGQGTCI